MNAITIFFSAQIILIQLQPVLGVFIIKIYDIVLPAAIIGCFKLGVIITLLIPLCFHMFTFPVFYFLVNLDRFSLLLKLLSVRNWSGSLASFPSHKYLFFLNNVIIFFTLGCEKGFCTFIHMAAEYERWDDDLTLLLECLNFCCVLSMFVYFSFLSLKGINKKPHCLCLTVKF